jgi:hypothetical protein
LVNNGRKLVKKYFAIPLFAIFFTHHFTMSPLHLVTAALGIGVESPERGTSEDLERKARPAGERQKKKSEVRLPTILYLC